jgi:hypothetical protein
MKTPLPGESSGVFHFCFSTDPPPEDRRRNSEATELKSRPSDTNRRHFLMHRQASFDKVAFRPRDHLKPGRPARDDDERAARHAEIERRYAKPLKDCGDQRRIAILRRRDLENLCRASDVPEDGGLDWLDIAANHIAFIYREVDAKIAAILRWRARFTPMVEVGMARELAERVVADPRMPKADELAHRLGLTMVRRTELGITTIGATDCGKAARAALRRKRDAARHKALRAKAGAAPHSNSARCTKPWQVRGISRATYYRNRKKMRLMRPIRPQPTRSV